MTTDTANFTVKIISRLSGYMVILKQIDGMSDTAPGMWVRIFTNYEEMEEILTGEMLIVLIRQRSPENQLHAPGQHTLNRAQFTALGFHPIYGAV
jgi:hypothetical protein